MIHNYNKEPEIRIRGYDEHCFTTWPGVLEELKRSLSRIPGIKKVMVVECYQGIHDDELTAHLHEGLNPDLLINTWDIMKSHDEIINLTYPDVTDDRIFGRITRLTMMDFMDVTKFQKAMMRLSGSNGNILVYGPGASLLAPDPGVLVYADMARWEIQLRMRRNTVRNLGLNNCMESTETQYKRGYFVDWRVCDRLKKSLLDRWNYVLDSNTTGRPVLVSGIAYREAMNHAVSRPFSVVPYFDAGPWGGQWMKDRFGLDQDAQNFAWCFNCVPEENSLYLRFGETRFETPAVNLVFSQPRMLLGDPVHARFGDEFPIRFDYLDTMGGGNLSLQVHPLTDYIREEFGIPYTQDESYYLLEAGNDAQVYLGMKTGSDPGEMGRQLEVSQATGSTFADSRFVNSWPAGKHDHFLIPAGTVHCSGKDCMVLEISATPYIFTFKLWDWGRMGLDGKPRPINIQRGLANIQWHRNTAWVEQNLINRIQPVASGKGWQEEKTGLHEREFIETRRHWFTEKVTHHTCNGVNVIALVEGDEILVESPAGAFEPFEVHYAEVFIVPAAVGEYTITPYGKAVGKKCATIKAYVRVNG